jgi:hypothetical protein
VVSGSVSSPSRGAFHLSLTVLVHYRLHEVFSLGGWSPLLPTRFHVSRGTQDPGPVEQSSSTGLSPALVARSSAFKSSFAFVASPTTPPFLTKERFGLFPVRSPLLRESRLISLGQATEMFQFAHFPSQRLCVQRWISRHHSGWVAPFGFLGFMAWMQLPPNVSPVSASFFGFMHPGILLVLCVACSLLDTHEWPVCLSLVGTLLFSVSAVHSADVLTSALSKIEETHLFDCSRATGVGSPTPQEWKPVSFLTSSAVSNALVRAPNLVSTWKLMNFVVWSSAPNVHRSSLERR